LDLRREDEMTSSRELYTCQECGNIVEVVHANRGTLVCCGQPMQRLVEKTTDAGNEKHVPVIEKTPAGILIKVGAVPHPMEEKHYIEWVELLADGLVYRRFLKPGMKPEFVFSVQPQAVTARAYCNVHGLWASK
jgi:superoxide reductase